jgi:hypothetical protein
MPAATRAAVTGHGVVVIGGANAIDESILYGANCR